MRTITKLGLGLVLLAGLGAGSYYIWGETRDKQNASAMLSLFGNVDIRQVTLGFRVPGRISEVLVEEGDRVVQGASIATLEQGDFRDQLNLARAKDEASAAVLATLEAGTREEDIAQARAGLAQAEAALRLARTERDRQATLALRDIASHQAHEAAQAAYDEAAAGVQAARAALSLAEIGPRSEDIRQARAALAAERAALSIAERRLTDSRLVAPNDGVILSRIREAGSIIGAGEPIVTLSLTSPVWVRSYVDEPDLGRIAPGMTAEVLTDSGGRYTGQIGFISPVAEFTPKSVETRALRTSLVYRIRVVVDAPDAGLRQGMPVTVLLTPRAG